MPCRHCGKELPLFKKLADNDFCSAEHRELFVEGQQKLLLSRLEESRRRLKARRVSAAPPLEPEDRNPPPAPLHGFLPPPPFLRDMRFSTLATDVEFAPPQVSAWPVGQYSEQRRLPCGRTEIPLRTLDVASRHLTQARGLEDAVGVSFTPISALLIPHSIYEPFATPRLSERLYRMRPKAGHDCASNPRLDAHMCAEQRRPAVPALGLRVIGVSLAVPDELAPPLKVRLKAVADADLPAWKAVETGDTEWSAAPAIGRVCLKPTACQPRLSEHVYRARPRAGIGENTCALVIGGMESEFDFAPWKLALPHLRAAVLGVVSVPPLLTRAFRMRPRAGVGEGTCAAITGGIEARFEFAPWKLLLPPLRAAVIGADSVPPMLTRGFRMRPRVGVADHKVAAFEAIEAGAVIDGLGIRAVLPAALLTLAVPTPAAHDRVFRSRPKHPVEDPALPPITAVAPGEPCAFLFRPRQVALQPAARSWNPPQSDRFYRMRPRQGHDVALVIAGSAAAIPGSVRAVAPCVTPRTLMPRTAERTYKMRPRAGVNDPALAIHTVHAGSLFAMEPCVQPPVVRPTECIPAPTDRIFRMRARAGVNCPSTVCREIPAGPAEPSEIFVMPPVPELQVEHVYHLPRPERQSRLNPPGPLAGGGMHGGPGSDGTDTIDPAMVACASIGPVFPTMQLPPFAAPRQPRSRWLAWFHQLLRPPQWAATPAFRFATCGAAIVAAVIVYAASTSSASVSSNVQRKADRTAAGPLTVVKQQLAGRAAVEVVEDFKSGLFRWQGGPNWADTWTYDESGGIKPGALALLTPTLQLSDYTLEFLAQIESSGLGFVARAADINDYYAVRLVIARPGPVTVIDIARYAVLGGQAQERARKRMPLTVFKDTIYRVRLAVRDDVYRLDVNDTVVDSWTENRLPSGGVGFFTSRGERARIMGVSVTNQVDTVGRAVAYVVSNASEQGKRISE